MCKFKPCMDGSYTVQYLGRVATGGYHHPWRFVDLPAQECTCGDWHDEFPCVHAICLAVAEVRTLDTLYDAAHLSVAYFRDTYNQPFKPWPIHVTLAVDSSLRLPQVTAAPLELGTRGLKPGPNRNTSARELLTVLEATQHVPNLDTLIIQYTRAF